MKYRLSQKYTIEFSIQNSFNGPAGLNCEWYPHQPSKKKMRKLWGKYVAARHKFLLAAGDEIGRSVVVVDTTPQIAAALMAAQPGTRH
jgi:hypothetical protein